MLRVSQRRRLLRQAAALPSDLILHLPDPERALYLRIKDQLETKRRQGSEWIDPTAAVAKNKVVVNSDRVRGGSCNSADAPSVQSAVTEDLTVYSSSSNMMGSDESSGSFTANHEITANESLGLSFEEYSCSTCSYVCSFEQHDHHDQQNHHHDNCQATGSSTIQSGGSSALVCEECGTLSASSSFKQEETEIVFDSDLYRSMKSNHMLFATPFLREQHLKVLRTSESLYDQAVCSMQSEEDDREDEFSYRGFFLEESEEVDDDQPKLRRQKPQPHTVMTERATTASVPESPAAEDLKDGKPFATCAGYFSDEETFYTARSYTSNKNIKCGGGRSIGASKKEEDIETAADFSYKAFFLDEVIPMQKRYSAGANESDSLLLSNAERETHPRSTLPKKSIVVDSCDSPDDISYSGFFLGEIDIQPSQRDWEKESRNNRYDKSETSNIHVNGRMEHVTESNTDMAHDKVLLGMSNEENRERTSFQSKDISNRSTSSIMPVAVLHRPYDGVEESNHLVAAEAIYIGEVDETMLDRGQSARAHDIGLGTLTTDTGKHSQSDRSVESLLAAFDYLHASWVAIHGCSISLVPHDEKRNDKLVSAGKFGVLSVWDLKESLDVDGYFADKISDEPTFGSFRIGNILYDDLSIHPSTYSQEIYKSGEDNAFNEDKGDAPTVVCGNENRTVLEKALCTAQPETEFNEKKKRTATTRLQISIETSVSPMPDTVPILTSIRRGDNYRTSARTGSKPVYEAQWSISVEDYHSLRILVSLQKIPR